MVVVVVMVVVVRQDLRLGEGGDLHQGLVVLVSLERAQGRLGQHGLRGQHGLQLLQGQRLSGGDGEGQRRRDHARGQDDVGPGPGYDQGGVAGVGPVVLGCLVVPQGEPRLGWPQRQLHALDLPQGPLDLAQGALDQDRALAQPRNVLVQQERALRAGRRGRHGRVVMVIVTITPYECGLLGLYSYGLRLLPIQCTTSIGTAHYHVPTVPQNFILPAETITAVFLWNLKMMSLKRLSSFLPTGGLPLAESGIERLTWATFK